MDTVEFRFPLGAKVRDRVSDFEGIIEVRHEHLNGCKRYTVTGKITKDGEIKGYIIDEGQLELISKGGIKVQKSIGGPGTTRASYA